MKSICFKLLFVQVLMFSYLYSFAFSWGGPGAGGGSNVCQITSNGQTVLYAYSVHAKQFLNDPNYGHVSPSRLQAINNNQRQVINRSDFNVVVVTAKNILSLMGESVRTSKQATDLWIQAIDKLKFYQTNNQGKSPFRVVYSQASACQNSSVKLIAEYNKNDHSVTISQPLWNKLNFDSQVGVILTEGLRQRQYFSGFSRYSDKTKNIHVDNDIQKIVTQTLYHVNVQNLNAHVLFSETLRKQTMKTHPCSLFSNKDSDLILLRSQQRGKKLLNEYFQMCRAGSLDRNGIIQLQEMLFEEQLDLIVDGVHKKFPIYDLTLQTLGTQLVNAGYFE